MEQDMEYLKKLCEEDSFIETISFKDNQRRRLPMERITNMMPLTMKSKVRSFYSIYIYTQDDTVEHFSQFPNLKTYQGDVFPGLAKITSLESYQDIGKMTITSERLLEIAYTFLNPNFQVFIWTRTSPRDSIIRLVIGILAGFNVDSLLERFEKSTLTDALENIDPEKLIYTGKSKILLDLPHCVQSARWMLVPGMFSEIQTLIIDFLPEVEWIVKFFRTCGSKLKTISLDIHNQTDEIFNAFHEELVRIYIHRRDILKLPPAECKFHSIGYLKKSEHLMNFLDSEFRCHTYLVSARFLSGRDECGRILDKIKEGDDIRLVGTIELENGPRSMEFLIRFSPYLRIHIALKGIPGCYYWIKSFALHYDPNCELRYFNVSNTNATPLHRLCETAIGTLRWRNTVEERARFVEFFKQLLELVFSVDPDSGEITNNYPTSSFGKVLRHLGIVKPTIKEFSADDLTD